MEIELKYLLKDRNEADRILEDDIVSGVKDPDSFETLDMHAVYYDTEDLALTKSGIAIRVRREGEYYVATMKDKGTSASGLHRRREINVRLDNKAMIEEPDVTIFSESEEYEELLMIAGKDKLTPLLEMEFERRQVKIDTGSSISELSVDDGVMKANGKELPIMELELELYSGDEEEMTRFGEKLAEKYSLTPEDRSKFARAFALIEG